ncbi:MAG: polysaccharide biosynthesis/export family protein [Prosthecobacter sp.]|uniref:polysaccharide biosynthesis/export family protein n=1 Tax=Prosthecobacter sp. TaxID=1965333 RepID=UPI0038FFEAFC
MLLVRLWPFLLLSSCALPGERTTFDAHEASAALRFAQTQRRGVIQPEWLQPSQKAYALGPGDKLEMEILGEKGTRAETFVTPDAKVYFDLMPGLDVKGKTTTQLQQEMEKLLVQYYRQPQVAVTLKEVCSQRVWVLGRVNAPGVYPLKRPLRVLDAVTLAGGLFASVLAGTTEELADLKHSFIMRGGQMLPVDFQQLIRAGDLSQNIYLEPDDFIYLPSAMANEVYVMGAVKTARPVAFVNDMNLVAAISGGLGLYPGADLTRVKIIRGSLTEPKIATVDALDIMNGKTTNVRLEPGDIVYVPGKGTISPGGYLHDAMNTFTRLVAANEGNHAGAPGGSPIGVNLNLGGQN